MTHSERTILRQFFSIETLDPECKHHVAVTEPDWDITPTQVVPLTDAAVSELSSDNPESPDSPNSLAAVEALPSPDELQFGVKEEDRLEENAERPIAEPAAEVWRGVPYGLLSSTSRQRRALYITIVFVLMAVGVVALVKKSGQPSSQIAARQSDSSVASQSTVKPDESKSTETSVAKPTGSLVPIPEPQSKQVEQASSVAQDLSGKWTVVNTVEETSYRSFKNLEIGFRLAINQTGRKFTAKGEKVSENGRTLPAGNRTPIHVTGSINGDRIEATFFEEGMLRKTNGRFVWRIVKTGSGLAGTFVSSAARTRGKSAATKEL